MLPVTGATPEPTPADTRSRDRGNASPQGDEAVTDQSDDPALTTLRAGVAFLNRIQRDGGHWEDEVVWCPMLTAQYVMTSYIMGRKIPDDRVAKFTRYFDVWQLPDGSWGMHAESPGYLFVTSLSYVAMRMMGHAADDPRMQRARRWIRDQGGATKVPSWGKLWLALVNVYGWEGVNPILPELWTLPDSNPAHPRRYYCHTRLIYLPIGVLYGVRYQAPADSLVRALRDELYNEPYDAIDFGRHRNAMIERDMFAWPTVPIKLAYEASRLFDMVAPSSMRRRAIERCVEHVRHHLRESRYASISPVNGLLNCLALWVIDPEDNDAQLGYEGADYWLWEDEEEGLRFNGARSQTWDTSFAVQAIAAGPAVDMAHESFARAAQYYDEHQMLDDIDDRERWYRDRLLGGFCFSDRHHRWPVSDTTGEALAAMAAIADLGVKRLPDERYTMAAEFLLTRQNDDGGWGSYERKRGNLLLEHLNPSEMFGNCMVEHSYIECTASCMRGLLAYRKLVRHRPPALDVAISKSIVAGAALLRRSQRKDGSWPGFWGVNFTYGTMFGISGLRDAGATTDDPAIVRARNWLIGAQLCDGGWGEVWQSCVEERYMPSDYSQVIMTAWALLGLFAAGERRRSVLDPAIGVLMARQRSDGSWPKEGVGGVFFNTAMHHYKLYKDYFPVWALGEYVQLSERGELT